ncbi:hypothetical protein GJ496_007406 [Pomphorhynchus laevis]|nr:hypothetical protein GJ496_007406 [Pomphorhynchus laevis]
MCTSEHSKDFHCCNSTADFSGKSTISQGKVFLLKKILEMQARKGADIQSEQIRPCSNPFCTIYFLLQYIGVAFHFLMVYLVGLFEVVDASFLPIHLLALSRSYYPQYDSIGIASLGCTRPPLECVPTYLIANRRSFQWKLVPAHDLTVFESLKIEGADLNRSIVIEVSSIGDYLCRRWSIKHNKSIEFHRHEQFPSLWFVRITLN